MRPSRVLAVLFALVAIGCGGGPVADAGTDSGPVDTGVDVVYTGGPLCTDVAHESTMPVPYGPCSGMCPTGYSCGYANPGVDAGVGPPTVNICRALETK